VLAGTIIALLLQGCATTRGDPERSRVIDDVLADAANRQSAPVQPPPSVLADLLAPVADDLGHLAPDQQGGRFNVSVFNAPAREFFMSLAEDTPYNIIVHPKVDGSITLQLKSVTLDELLELVRTTYGYEYQKTGMNYVILPTQLQTRMFEVAYLNINRGGQSGTQVSSGQVTQSSSGGSDSGSSSSSSSSGSSSGSGGGATTTPFGSQIITQTQSGYWVELTGTLCTLIGLPLNAASNSSSGEVIGGVSLGCSEIVAAATDGSSNSSAAVMLRSIAVSPQSGMVVVRAFPDELRQIEQVLRTSERNVQRQVILEAKIIEVELSDGFQSGINWAGIAAFNSGDSTLQFGQTGGGSIFNSGRSEIEGNAGLLDPDNLLAPITSATSAFGGVNTFVLNTQDFNAFIELLKTQGDVQVLSSPRVSTLNNQKAVIKVGNDEYFITDLESTNTSTAAGTTVTPDVTLTPFFSGIALDVTPQVSENEVVLHIHPMVTEVITQNKQFTLNNSTQIIPLAFSSVRETDTIVRARDGQVIVIGGLMSDRSERNNAGLPGLSNIPGVGELFKHRNNKSRKTELVILLRPILAKTDSVWQREIEASRKRINDMQGLPANTAQGQE
jgi:MSHA biogenesis protein MshL